MSGAARGPEDRQAHSPGTDGGAGAGCAEAVVDAARPAGRALAALAGLREPVVWILLAIAFFTAISGKPVDGVLMLLVAVKNAMASNIQTTGSRSPARVARTRPAGRAVSTTASAHPAPAPSVPGPPACRSSGPGAARLTRTS